MSLYAPAQTYDSAQVQKLWRLAQLQTTNLASFQTVNLRRLYHFANL